MKVMYKIFFILILIELHSSDFCQYLFFKKTFSQWEKHSVREKIDEMFSVLYCHFFVYLSFVFQIKLCAEKTTIYKPSAKQMETSPVIKVSSGVPFTKMD